MSLFISSLASGSNGNCYYIGNDTEAILVDAGVSCREIEKRMKRLGLSIQKVKAVFISHEHSDHIRGIYILSKKYNLPVYTTEATLKCGAFYLDKALWRSFTPDEPTIIGKLLVTAFSKLHDAVDPYSFVVTHNQIRIGVFTDIGLPCQRVIHYFSQCHAAFLEANYDEEMLETGGYPYYLKKRICSEHGHLSNKQALELFRIYKPSYMSHLVLSHLSKNNNCPKLVNELFTGHADGTKIIVASRYEESAVFTIHQSGSINPAPLAQIPQLAFEFD